MGSLYPGTTPHRNEENEIILTTEWIIWPETTRVGVGLFACPPGDSDFLQGGTYVVARYLPPQMAGQRAWRPSASNPFGYSDVTDHGKSSWNEEDWIKKYGPGHRL